MEVISLMNYHIDMEEDLILNTKEIIFKSFMIYLALSFVTTYIIVLTRTAVELRTGILINATIFLIIPTMSFLLVHYSKFSSRVKIALYCSVMVVFYITTCVFYFEEPTHFTNILLAINIMILFSLAGNHFWTYGFAILAFVVLMFSIYFKEDDLLYFTSVGVLVPTTYACTMLVKRSKKYISDLTNLNKSLDLKVKERTASLEQSNTSLTESNEELQATLEDLKETQQRLVEAKRIAALNHVVSGVAHEINTPIGVGVTTITYLEKVTEDIKLSLSNNQISKSQLLNKIENIETSSKLIERSLLSAINLIDQFKKISPYKKEVHEKNVDLCLVLEHFKNDRVESLEEYNVTVDIDCEPVLMKLNPDILLEILNALLDNSITHGFKGRSVGNINIKIQKIKENIHLSFKNDGLQIDDENLEKIFVPFFSTTQDDMHHGLGLNIVHSIVTGILKGNVTAKNLQSVGVEFLIVFPSDTT